MECYFYYKYYLKSSRNPAVPAVNNVIMGWCIIFRKKCVFLPLPCGHMYNLTSEGLNILYSSVADPDPVGSGLLGHPDLDSIKKLKMQVYLSKVRVRIRIRYFSVTRIWIRFFQYRIRRSGSGKNTGLHHQCNRPVYGWYRTVNRQEGLGTQIHRFGAGDRFKYRDIYTLHFILVFFSSIFF